MFSVQMLYSGAPCVSSNGEKKRDKMESKMESLLMTIKPSKVVLKDIMPKRKLGSVQEKKIESIRRVVQTYNCAHQPVSQYFKRVASTAMNSDEMFTICEAFHRAVANDHKYTEMLTEAMCNLLSYDLCRLETLKFDERLSLEAATKEIMSYEIKLSHRYQLLAKILRRSEMLARECYLTAFSLNPTWVNYLALVRIHEQYSSSKRHKSLDGFNSVLGAQETKHEDYDPIADPVHMILKGDKLATRLDQSDLWSDLTTVITSPRIKTLRWSTHDWFELQQQCLHFLSNAQLKADLVKQNVAAINQDKKHLRYARENSRILAKRVFQRTLKRLRNRKLKHERRRHACCLDQSGGLMGFVKM